MNQLFAVKYEVNEDIRKGKNYIFGAGNHAVHMGKWFTYYQSKLRWYPPGIVQ